MRQPQQIHVFLYRQRDDGVYEYAIFQRADNPLYWQGVCGGVEEGETLKQSVRRELYEEAGILDNSPLYHLDTISSLPANIFHPNAQAIWGKDIVVVPMYFYAMPYKGEIKLSEEHTAVRWCTYDEARKLIYWHDQQTALWELHQRILRGNLYR